MPPPKVRCRFVVVVVAWSSVRERTVERVEAERVDEGVMVERDCWNLREERRVCVKRERWCWRVWTVIVSQSIVSE